MSTAQAMTLRPYQQAQLDAILNAYHKDGLNRVVVKSPTGTGKTVTFAAMLQHAGFRAWLEQFPAGERRMMVIAHREELLDQAADKIRRANPGLLVAVEQGDRRASQHVDVIVASIQTLAAMKFRRLERFLERMKIRLVIVDECHHSAARTYRQALHKLGFLPPVPDKDAGPDDVDAAREGDVAEMEKLLKGWDRVAPRDRLLVGFTATPNRSDAVGLNCVFQSIAYSYALKDAIADKWLVPLRTFVIETDVDLDAVHTARGDFHQRELAEAVNNDRRNAWAVAGWREKAENRSTIAFTVDVAHAHALAKKFQDAGVDAAAVSGETPKDERRRLLERFQAGDLKVLTNCMVLTEGTDLPRAGCILHTKPTKSATLYEQMTGRGLRLFEGKDDCIVIDVVDVAKRHSLQTAPVLYGLPPGLIEQGKLLDDIKDEWDEFREEFEAFDIDAALANGAHLSLAELRARAKAIDVWQVPDLGTFGQGRQLGGWLKIGEDEYQVEYPWEDSLGRAGTERLRVSPDFLGRFDLVLTWTERLEAGDRGRKAARTQATIGAGILTADAAAAVAEAFVLQNRRKVAKLQDVNATWRGKMATPGQLGFLRKLGVPTKPGMSAGEASSLIDLALSRRKGRR